MHIVGVDENGLGPRLGPLLATAVTLEVEEAREPTLDDVVRALGVDDSKAVSGFGRMASAESIASAIVERISGQLPRTADDVVVALSLDTTAILHARCPQEGTTPCWGDPVALPAFRGDPDEGRQALAVLDARGVHLTHARSVITCVRALNEELALGISKLRVDLGAFERLLADARRMAGADIVAVCGMVGGIRDYPAHFRHFAANDVTSAAPSRGCARYSIRDVGDVRFEADADARHVPVALASLVGKYLRELLMERQNRVYRAMDPALPAASGYHDPVTARFVDASVQIRARLGVRDVCFERQR